MDILSSMWEATIFLIVVSSIIVHCLNRYGNKISDVVQFARALALTIFTVFTVVAILLGFATYVYYTAEFKVICGG